MENKELAEYFMRASRLRADKGKYQTSERWDEQRLKDGAKRFKRAVFGLCGSRTTKTIDELVEIFIKLGIVASTDDGRQLVNGLNGSILTYSGSSLIHSVYFDEVENIDGRKAIRMDHFRHWIPAD